MCSCCIMVTGSTGGGGGSGGRVDKLQLKLRWKVGTIGTMEMESVRLV